MAGVTMPTAKGNLLLNYEKEQEHMDLHNHVFRISLGGPIYRVPIPSNVHRVLDLGTGTGIWTFDVADEHPSAKVIKNDLSPIQPAYVPPNCRFVIDNIEAAWTYRLNEAFDYIHDRGLGGSVRGWSLFNLRVYQHLKLGGWVEVQEYEAWMRSGDDPDLLGCPVVLQRQQLVDEASIIFGKKVNVADSVKKRLIDAGFEGVKDDTYKLCSLSK